MKIPFQFFWNIQNFVLSWKQSLWRKKSMFWGLFNFRENRCIRTLPVCPFFGWFWVFFKMLKIPFQFFWNIQNFILSLKTIGLKKKKDVLGIFQFFVKSLYLDHTGMAIFWLILSIFWKVKNTLPILSETFKILFYHENNHFEEKKACFGDFSIFGKISVSGRYRHGHFLVDFEYFLKYWKYPSYSSENIQNFFPFIENNRFEEKKGCFGDFSIFGKIAVSGPLPAWPFFGWFWVFFERLKILFEFLWNIQNFVLSWKQSVWRKKSMFWGLLNFSQNRCIRTLPACHFLVDFEYFLKYWKYHSNSSETLKIFFFHWNNRFEEKKACFGEFQFLAKSLYPDLTVVAIFWVILSIF